MATPWVERLSSAGFTGQIDEISNQIERLSELEEAAEYLARLRLVLELVQAQVENVEPMLVTQGHITNLQNGLRSVLDAAAAVQPGDPATLSAQLVALDGRVDDLLALLSAWPTPPPAKVASASKKALDQLTRTASEGRSRIEERTQAMEQRVGQVTTEVEQQKSETDALVTNLRSVQERAEGQISEHESRLTSALSQYQATFDNQQQERTTQFGRELDEHRQALEEAVTGLKTSSETTTRELVETATKRISEIEEQLAKAKTNVGLITQTSMTGNYAEFANKEDDKANAWRIGTITTGVVFLLGLGALFGYEELEKVEVVSDASKVTLGVAFGALASYCARQSAAHRRAARHARSLQLALSALPAYLEEIDDNDKRKAMLENFAYYFFSRDIPHGRDEGVYQPADSWKEKFLRRWVSRPPP